jgi:small-conductance mechanosensitive channel
MNGFVPAPDLSLLTALDGQTLLRNAFLTGLLWAAALLLRFLTGRALSVRGVFGEARRRFLASTRNLMLLVLLVGTAAIWFEELKVFALSLVAVAAAVVIATKELIMCMGGSFLRVSGRMFDIGDRIEVGGARGDVVDTSWLSTTLIEIGPGHVGHQRTGRTLVIPNSLFLTTPVVNENIDDAYVLHSFRVLVKNDVSWQAREAALLEAARAELLRYADDAKSYFERSARERSIETPAQEARVVIEVQSPEVLVLHCRLPAPSRTRGTIEQAIVRRLLASS